MNRCENKGLFDKTVSLINDFKNYFKSHNQTIYENPSPGNKKGGISTLEDIRSLHQRGLYGAILGKALYTGVINLAEALQAAKEGSKC